ncbi:MAG TPA: hypothetical protein VM889_13345 [Candidatus Thermoplasmatota archaeon]|nr:hypothetical protein [Candidatus Thermoplasmatota archaeon]HWH08113.1 hypothetical protein [Candidatus Thermoplasmatota archaeon]
MAVQKDFRTGVIANLAAGASSEVVNEALTGQEMLTIERLGVTPHADLRVTLEVEKTTVYKDLPTQSAAFPVSDANAEVFLCTPVVGVLPEKRWKVTIKNVGAAAVANVRYYVPVTKYTGADLQRVL